jgi:hypothetical protein
MQQGAIGNGHSTIARQAQGPECHGRLYLARLRWFAENGPAACALVRLCISRAGRQHGNSARVESHSKPAMYTIY